MNTPCPSCGSQMWIDELLTASSLTNPCFGLCCLSGKINLPIPQSPPQELLDLITNHDPTNALSIQFHTNIRAYNSLFAFASVRANYDPQLASGRDGVSTYHINGTLYRCLGPLRATDPAQASFSQIYFCDENEQTTRRQTMFTGLDENIIQMIQTWITQHNLFARTLRTASEAYANQTVGTI
ncbi:hypothetical protein INT45_006662 [Circinella minor]|uniref:Uncharacterized protein n=1 Tax=Circinella minor TaxID=1195481 RepID=A0A8H7RSA3_9FUNG|nr:hypothetical protein INT45_006662 [Circinella minor]